MIDENSEKAFYGSEDSEKEEEEEEEKEKEEKPKKKPYIMDPDHRLLLRTCKPLLNSRNASVSDRGQGVLSIMITDIDHGLITSLMAVEFLQIQYFDN